ncbi:MAG: hypothetical protein KAS66_12310 [Candidatus Omnitrophica bacterium]|nr:hypothetical protein [Candidatus Omnitrophota bacterium]
MNKKQIKKDVPRGGQSILEYILLVGVIIALLVIFLRPGGYFSRVYNRMIQRQSDDVLNAAKVLF